MFTEDCSLSQDLYSEMAEKCVTCVRNPFIWPRLKAHIQAFAGIKSGLHPDPIHLAVRKSMKLRVDRCGPPQGAMKIQKDSDAPSYFDALVLRMKKKKNGFFPKPQTSAKTRWGTRLEGQWQLGVNGRALAAGLIQATGDGTLEALQKGAAAPFEASGFQVDGSLRTSAKLGSHLRCLTSQEFSFYHAVGRFLCVYTGRPVLSAFSKHLECSALSVCGVSSYFRRLLHLVTDKMYVGHFNSTDCEPTVPYRNAQSADRSETNPFTGTSHKFNVQTRKKKSADRPHGTVKLAHRGWTSLAGSHKSLFLLNPNAKVREVFGNSTTSEMDGGVRALVCDLRRTAEMDGELTFLPTLERKWAACEKAKAVPAQNSNWSAVVAAGKDKPVVKAGATPDAERRTANAVAGAQYARNMHKAQWAVREIMNDVVRATEKWFDNELYSLFGFLACMIKTRWVDVWNVQTCEKMKILIADVDAISNGQVGSRMLDELKAHFINQGEPGFVDFYPPQLTDMLTDDVAMRQLSEFLRGDAMEGFHLLDAEGNTLFEDVKPVTQDAQGNRMRQPIVVGPKPIWQFPALARRVLTICLRQLASNDVERVLSLVAVKYRGGGKNVSFRCISSWIKRRDWVSGRYFGMEVNPDFLKVYGAARRLMRKNETAFQAVYTLDINTGEQRKRWRQQNDLPAYAKVGQKFRKTNIVPYRQERMVGTKSNMSEDPSDIAVKPTAHRVNKPNERRRQRLAVHLRKIKSSRFSKPRANALPIGKRKRPVMAVPPEKSQRTSVHESSEPASQMKPDCEVSLGSAPSPGNALSDPAAALSTPAAEPASERNEGTGMRSSETRSGLNSNTEPEYCGAAPAGAAASGGALVQAATPRGNFDSHPLLSKMQNELDGLAEGTWTPSRRVTITSASGRDKFVFGMQRPGAGAVHIVRCKESSCTFNLAYDESDGVVKIIKICRAPPDTRGSSGVKTDLRMEYYFVYPNGRAQLEAEFQNDTNLTFIDRGTSRSYTQIGATTLGTKAEFWKGVALHHVGDVLHKSSEHGAMNLGNIVGTIAWVPVESLVDGSLHRTNLCDADKKKLLTSLKTLGIPDNVAADLAKNPLYLGCNFGEKRPLAPTESSESDDHDETEDETDNVIVKEPTIAEARAVRETLESEELVETKDAKDSD